MSAKRTVKRIQSTGSAGKTDWARVEKLSDRNREKAIASDPDAATLLDRQWFESAELVLPERKVQLALRIDQDVVRWFKEQGPRYQTRMNAVLRAYMKAHAESA